jgi:hypothetical protein
MMMNNFQSFLDLIVQIGFIARTGRGVIEGQALRVHEAKSDSNYQKYVVLGNDLLRKYYETIARSSHSLTRVKNMCCARTSCVARRLQCLHANHFL